MRFLPPVLACACLASACSAGTEEPPAAGTTEKAAELASAEISASAAPAVAREESVSNDLYEFHYSYPAAGAALPELGKWLDADLEARRRQLIEDAEEQLAESKRSGFPFHPLGYWVDWKVVADLPDWLSLSAEVSTYLGGAHPNHGFDSLLWDRRARVRREPLELFTLKAALSRAIRPDFCREIDEQRAKRRGEPVKPGSDEPFSDCIDPVENTVILGSSNRRVFDRIGILVAPYAAGPYAEGDFEVTLPVTDAVMAAVKPEFRASFAKGR